MSSIFHHHYTYSAIASLFLFIICREHGLLGVNLQDVYLRDNNKRTLRFQNNTSLSFSHHESNNTSTVTSENNMVYDLPQPIASSFSDSFGNHESNTLVLENNTINDSPQSITSLSPELNLLSKPLRLSEDEQRIVHRYQNLLLQGYTPLAVKNKMVDDQIDSKYIDIVLNLDEIVNEGLGVVDDRSSSDESDIELRISEDEQHIVTKYRKLLETYKPLAVKNKMIQDQIDPKFIDAVLNVDNSYK